MNKTLLILLLSTVSCFASVQIRDNNGCVVGTSYATQTTIPWYLVEGKRRLEFYIDGKCPVVSKEFTEIKIPFGRVVGTLESIWADVYITVPTKNEVKYFPTRDVFIESTQEWSFKDLRGK